MQEISLPKLGGFVVIKNRIYVQDTMRPGCYPNIYVHLRRPDTNGNWTYDSIYVPYPLDLGEWYPVKSINYPRKNWDSFHGIPWMVLALHRSKRKWCKAKVAKLVDEAVKNEQYSSYDKLSINTLSISIQAKDFNNKVYWVETESEAIKLGAELQGRTTTEPDPAQERWINLL